MRGRVDVLAVGGGVAVGWRAWSLRRERDGRLLLGSVFGWGEPWLPATPAAAACPRSHRAPDPSCTCGLHAASDPGLLPTVLDGDVAVVGTVSLWGRVIEHESGYRAEHAYPSSLRLVCSRCGRARDVARMVVGPRRGRPGRLIVACRRHLRRPHRGVLPARVVQERLLQGYGIDRLPEDAARRVRGWRTVAARRLLGTGLGRAVVAGLALAATLSMLISVAVVTGRLPA
jgi:hypothetical protein